MQQQISRQGELFVLSSPSGAGKSSLSRALLKADDNLKKSISVTTRTPRSSEKDGEDYHFVSTQNFEDFIREDKFIEYAEVFQNMYGTLKTEVMEFMQQGIDVLFDVDWQGAQKIQAQYPNDTVTIYILPPSLEELRNRLISRRQDSVEVIEYRMSQAANEVSHAHYYDYIIVNDDFNETIERLQVIIKAERMKRKNMIKLDEFYHNK